jgi:hypothetical protein
LRASGEKTNTTSITLLWWIMQPLQSNNSSTLHQWRFLYITGHRGGTTLPFSHQTISSCSLSNGHWTLHMAWDELCKPAFCTIRKSPGRMSAQNWLITIIRNKALR